MSRILTFSGVGSIGIYIHIGCSFKLLISVASVVCTKYKTCAIFSQISYFVQYKHVLQDVYILNMLSGFPWRYQ